MDTPEPESTGSRSSFGRRILRGLADGERANPLSRSSFPSAGALYLLAALVFTYPLSLQPGRAVDNIGDPLLNVWILAWDWHALTTRPLDLFDANIFYPNRNSLAYSENLVFPALLAAPVQALTGNPVLAHNFVLLLSFPLTALAAYALVRHHTGSGSAAFVGGFVFAFAHYRLGQLSHLQLLPAFWLPLALLWLHRFAESQRLRWAALAGLALGLQWWTTIYYAFYLALAAALFALWALATGRLRLNRATLAGGLLAVLVAGALIAPGLRPYLAVGASVGERTLGQQEGAALADYARPQPRSLLGRALGLAGGHWEHTLFPGIVALALAGAGVFERKASQPAALPSEKSGAPGASAWPFPIRWTPYSYYLLLALAGLVLSFGPALHLNPEEPPLLQGLPYAWLYRAAPPLAALRVPARLAVLVMLALAVLAGRGVVVLSGLLKSWQANQPQRHQGHKVTLRGDSLLGLTAIAILALEYLSLPVPHAPIETGALVPPVYRWLAAQPAEGALFELPTARTPNITGDQESIRRIARQQYFSTYHWHPLVVGYSGTNAPTFQDVIDFAPAAASPPGLGLLRDLGVTRIVVHRDQMTWDEWATFAESAARRPGLALAAEVGEAAVFALQPGAVAALPERWQAMNLDIEPGLRLAAFDLPGGAAYTAGEALLVRLRWETSPQAARGRAVSLQVMRDVDEKVAQADYFFPAGHEWPAGPALEQRSIISLPRDLLPGEYSLRAVVYRTEDLAPVGAAAELAGLRVRQPPAFLIQHAHPARLGEAAALLGFDAEQTARPGEAFLLTLYWQRLSAIDEDYTVFVHVRRPDGGVLAQQDNPPRAGAYPTSAWRAGETVLDRYVLSIPPDAAPGVYALAVGMYLPGAGARLPAFDAQGSPQPEDSLLLGSIEVAP